MKYFMGIDIGTNESKGVIIDENCNIVVKASVGHETENPKPGYYEHDAEKIWWGDFCKLSNKLIADSKIDPQDIKCVGNSALSADVVPVDENCVPLRKAILYGIDARAEKECEFITNYYGAEKTEEIWGAPLCSSDCMPKIMWIKNNEPDIWEKAYKFLTASSYLTAKLTGKYTIDRYLAISSFLPGYNSDLSINKELTEELYCRADQLPEGKETADIVGTVTEKASKETGLAVGTKVVTGTDDSGAEAISTGCLEPGDFMIQLGSTCYLMYCSEKNVYDDRIWTGDYLVPGTYCQDGGTNTAGALTKWLRNNIYSDFLKVQEEGGENAFAQMAKEADKVPAGSEGLVVLPYFAGERTPINDPNSRGVFFGLLDRHTRAHMYRASLEGVAYSLAQHINILKENNLEIKNFMCVGGGTQNKQWLQIISDVTGLELKTAKVTMGSSYGDAMIAAIGEGTVKSYSELHKFIKPGDVYKPNMENHELYKKYYSIYERLYNQTKDLMHELTDIAGGAEFEE